MKFLIKAMIPVEMGNKLIKDGSLFTRMNEYFARVKPEALYFTITGGQRTVVFGSTSPPPTSCRSSPSRSGSG